MKFDNRDNYIKLGLKISYYRKLKGLTQEQLAEILDMSTAFIGKIEAPNIVKAVSLDTLFEIARIFDIAAYKLLFFEED